MALPVIHLIGDLHCGGSAAGGGISEARLNSFLASLPYLPKVGMNIQVGDLTSSSTEEQGDIAKALLAGLDAGYIAILGNHDTQGPRTGAEAVTDLNLPGINQSHDLEFCQVIALSHTDHHGGHIVLTQESLDFLDAELAACAPKPALLITHAPPYNTVQGAEENNSTDEPFFMVAADIANASNGVRDEPIRDILADHDNALAWISGHTHSPLDNPGLWMSIAVGDRQIIAGNAGAPYYERPPGWEIQSSSPQRTSILYVLRDRLEIRYYDCLRFRATTGPNGERLTIIYYDDGLVVHERRAA